MMFWIFIKAEETDMSQYVILEEADYLEKDDEFAKRGTELWYRIHPGLVNTQIGKIKKSMKLKYRRKLKDLDEEDCLRCKRKKDTGKHCWWCYYI